MDIDTDRPLAESILKTLESQCASGTLPDPEDLLPILLPLFEQVAEVHESGLVAPLDGLEKIKCYHGHAFFERDDCTPAKRNERTIQRVDRASTRSFEVTGQSAISEQEGQENLLVEDTDDTRAQPVFVQGYLSWEHSHDIHDEPCDIFVLGLVLASFSLNLDFRDNESLSLFVDNRENLFKIYPQLHPVFARVIVRMTELSRHQRAQSIDEVIHALENYRTQSVGGSIDFSELRGFKAASRTERDQKIHARLRNQCFQMTRRNRLLYFKPSAQSLDMTVTSVPLLLDVNNVRSKNLFYWHSKVAERVVSAKPIPLAEYLRFEDAPYIRGILDKIRNQARRDKAEYGSSQLRLVICFLRWHNLKESEHERIHSPLLLLPMTLTKKKGVKDTYMLQAESSQAEVNPVLRHHLNELYGIELPEFIDLAEADLSQLHQLLEQQIAASEPGVVLETVEQPQMELIHAEARLRLEQYRRRTRLSGRGVKHYEDIDYSYHRENFQPLGMQLYLQRVKQSAFPIMGESYRSPKREMPMLADAQAKKTTPTKDEKSKKANFYSLHNKGEEAGGNPYLWEIDLCAVTLGNFNYRKMSLVRDYNSILEENLSNPLFDNMFTEIDRSVQGVEEELPKWSDLFPVVESDPTQLKAIAAAGRGESSIIQGPPGTGKSQTITNLIADFAARGKRVLFVCEKRAAIDVVYHRLASRGLEQICSLIHDSQSDKKPFIMDVKATYEHYVEKGVPTARTRNKREKICEDLDRATEQLMWFSHQLNTEHEPIGQPLWKHYDWLVKERGNEVHLSSEWEELLPNYSDWHAHIPMLEGLIQTLDDLDGESIPARSPFRLLSPSLAGVEEPLNTVFNAIRASVKALEHVETILSAEHSFTNDSDLSMSELYRAIALITQLKKYCLDGECAALLRADSAEWTSLKLQVRQYEKVVDLLAKQQQVTSDWREKLDVRDARDAMEEVKGYEGNLFKVLKPSWWRMRKVLSQRYDFESHAVKPKWSRVLEELVREYDLQEELASLDEACYAETGVESTVLGLHEKLEGVRENAIHFEYPENAVYSAMASGGDSLANIRELYEAVKVLSDAIEGVFELPRSLSFSEFYKLIHDLEDCADDIPDVLPALGELIEAPESVMQTFRHMDSALNPMTVAIGQESLERVYRKDRALKTFNGTRLMREREAVNTLLDKYFDLNAKLILERAREHFLTNLNVSETSATQLSDREKEFKKRYSKGRKELEREFGKVMRYRSIRELGSGDSGLVLRDLKPIWLMSPLSVSDTLPIDPKLFDVVIFDEASQVPLEEAVPAIFRTCQCIVVGDEMQLPPTRFFSAKSDSADVDDGEEDELDSLLLDIDQGSLLSHCTRTLPSTMLGWHYRSRNEELISFSNRAFYQGRLLTVPDRDVNTEREAIVSTSAEDAAAHLDATLKRPISFHYIENGEYIKRRNPAEAAYIAEMVCSFLAQNNGLSLGIVAFSEAQQDEIESAINRLASDDRDFQEQLEVEYAREEDEQFCGLFVKNLENVQGDERDVIILSICYGHDAQNKMRMNFGPINQTGGEKRLNVVFSRAKRHMVVVSSIRHESITNTYNDGANCFKSYLEYAQASSEGAISMAELILERLCAMRQEDDQEFGISVEQLALALKERGFVVEIGVGVSEFRCDLAVRGADDATWRLGILLDNTVSSREDVLTRYYLQPSVLQAFGWDIQVIPIRDWYHEPDSVLDSIEKTLSKKQK